MQYLVNSIVSSYNIFPIYIYEEKEESNLSVTGNNL